MGLLDLQRQARVIQRQCQPRAKRFEHLTKLAVVRPVGPPGSAGSEDGHSEHGSVRIEGHQGVRPWIQLTRGRLDDRSPRHPSLGDDVFDLEAGEGCLIDGRRRGGHERSPSGGLGRAEIDPARVRHSRHEQQDDPFAHRAKLERRCQTARRIEEESPELGPA